MANPVVSYPGAKWRFYQYMVEYFPTDMKTFIEPFLGGGSVTLSVADDSRFQHLERMIAGDLYGEMYNMWLGIKQDPNAVFEIATQWFNQACPHQPAIHNTGITASLMKKYNNNEIDNDADKENIQQNMDLYNAAVLEGENFWKWAETVDTSTMTPEQRAARMLLVNKISFSGMGDSGSMSRDQFCDFKLDKLNSIFEANKLLQKVELYNVSFEDTMKYGNENPESSFIFLDPPYAKQESSGLYGKNGSTHHGFPHEQFAEYTKAMKCKWFMTYDDSVIVRKLFTGMTALGTPCYLMPFTIPGGYTMAGKTAEDALAGEELFIANYDINNMNNEDTDEF